LSARILGAGRALGSHIHSNEELARTAGVSPAWIVEKTGIKQRHYAAPGETTSSLALSAARLALENAGVEPDQIGMVIGATFTHDYLFPPLAAKLHRNLGLKGGQCYDIQANCSGYVSALVAASDRMRLDPSVGYALVVGSEVLSPFVDLQDAESSMYFSDVAGAVVIGGSTSPGIVSSAFDTDTSNYESVRCERNGLMVMNGIATWKQAMSHLPSTIRKAVERAGWRMNEIDLFIPHQANLQLIEFLAGRLGWQDRTFTNVAEIGNGGAASIPAAIADAMSEGRVRPGMKVVIAGIGAGFGFAAVTMVW